MFSEIDFNTGGFGPVVLAEITGKGDFLTDSLLANVLKERYQRLGAGGVGILKRVTFVYDYEIDV